MFAIQIWGGRGDVLREIALLPISRLRALNPGVRYLRLEDSKLHPDSGVPDVLIIRDLLSRCPHLKWADEGRCSRAEKILARGLRVLLEPLHPELFDPQFIWRPEDEIRLASDKFHIVVQTHLQGLPSKKWSVEHWRSVIAGLLRYFRGSCVHVLDPAGAVLSGDGVIVQDRLSLPQAIQLVESSDFLVSVDSWSKYVAGWKRIPQIVIVPDQTPDYPQLTASAVWRHSFRGLQKSGNLKLLGLSPDGPMRARYTFGSMRNLCPSEVLRSLEESCFPRET